MTDRSSYAIVARYEVTGDEALQYHSIGVACVMGEMLARGPEAPRPRGPEANANMFGSLLDFVRGSESLDGLEGVFLSAGLTALRVGGGSGAGRGWVGAAGTGGAGVGRRRWTARRPQWRRERRAVAGRCRSGRCGPTWSPSRVPGDTNGDTGPVRVVRCSRDRRCGARPRQR